MPRKKRPYDPKTKGCVPCSRRRIHCDLRGPVCRKCESRGLKCTGLVLQLQAVMPDLYEPPTRVPYRHDVPQVPSSGSHDTQLPPFSDSLQEHLYHGELLLNLQSSPQDSGHFRQDAVVEEVEDDPAYDLDDATWPSRDDGNALMRAADSVPSDVSSTQVILYADYEESEMEFPLITQPSAVSIPPWMTQMCLHFSNNIATEMVAVDGPFNNWRHILLPFAHNDDLVLQTLVTVTSCHFHLVNSPQTSDGTILAPNNKRITFESFPARFHQMYQNIFASLRLNSDMSQLPTERKHSILMTILLLLIGTMVTGRSDFPVFYRLLESAVESMGGEATLGNNDLGRFIKSQLAKFRFYGATMIDEKVGLQFISSTTHVTKLLDSLSRQWSEHPEHNETVTFVNDLTRQALDMYLEQAQSATTTTTSSGEAVTISNSVNSIVRVQHFIETLQSLPPSASCDRVLIWATFVAASGCVLDEHTQFFEGVLRRHYKRCKFLNVLAGLEALQRIWARNRSERWTSLIAQTRTLVM